MVHHGRKQVSFKKRVCTVMSFFREKIYIRWKTSGRIHTKLGRRIKGKLIGLVFVIRKLTLLYLNSLRAINFFKLRM